jgi:hypothetical protein
MKTVHVQDSMQDYTYSLSEPEGKHFDAEFKPELTPKQMMEMGIFGGDYFHGEQKEYPEAWFKNAKLTSVHDKSINFFDIDASQPLAEWQRKGWIYEEDPRGWFQWYCRYYMGRRIPEEDKRQIRRWKNMTRHIAQVKKYCEPGDLDCRKRQRQVLLHWAYDSRKI